MVLMKLHIYVYTPITVQQVVSKVPNSKLAKMSVINHTFSCLSKQDVGIEVAYTVCSIEYAPGLLWLYHKFAIDPYHLFAYIVQGCFPSTAAIVV